MSACNQEAPEQRVQDAVRRHARARAFTEADDVISAVLADLGVQEPRARVEATETELGMELSARLQPFQDRCDQAVAEGDTDGLAGLCGGSTAAGGDLRPARRARDLDGGTALGPQQQGQADRVGDSAPEVW
ncbi:MULTISPECIES: hypothetical protein [unclassified Streptomyces]|uniref:hypothetical protein n=1 Tax=unclassified Streptomyces TaxID=2593676 RepID=UPI00214BBEA2|nr:MULTISPECIES: hypothetical protein [unclassified Streptomyces]